MRLPKLQLHLTTCIVLMFVAGGLLWMNLTPTHAAKPYFSYEISYGWPLAVRSGWIDRGMRYPDSWTREELFEMAKIASLTLTETDDGMTVFESDTTKAELVYDNPVDRKSKLHIRHITEMFNKPSNILWNILTAFAILTTAAFACEWLFRRRSKEQRKQPR